MNGVLWNPIVAMLRNVRANRWHPIVYYESPLPGPADTDKPVRHKSKGHHTEGFATREEAVASAKQLAEVVAKECSDTGKCRLALEEDIPWGGDGIPANMAFFVETADGKLKKAF
jgi:hypothetical protein